MEKEASINSAETLIVSCSVVTITFPIVSDWGGNIYLASFVSVRRFVAPFKAVTVIEKLASKYAFKSVVPVGILIDICVFGNFPPSAETCLVLTKSFVPLFWLTHVS
jgi:hypothetical protein